MLWLKVVPALEGLKFFDVALIRHHFDDEQPLFSPATPMVADIQVDV